MTTQDTMSAEELLDDLSIFFYLYKERELSPEDVAHID
jgi:hypothetical protein